MTSDEKYVLLGDTLCAFWIGLLHYWGHTAWSIGVFAWYVFRSFSVTQDD